jgi:hypothetical protein
MAVPYCENKGSRSEISERLIRRGKSAQYDIAEPKSWIMGSIE